MRFFRYGGIYRSDVSSHLINLVPGSRFTVGSGPGYRTRRKNTPCPSSAMSSGRLFLDRVARQHCPSPLHRHTQINMHSAEALGKGDISILLGRGHFYFALTGDPGGPGCVLRCDRITSWSTLVFHSRERMRRGEFTSSLPLS